MTSNIEFEMGYKSTIDCKFSDEHYSFRYRAAAIIIENDEVLLAGADFDGNYTYYSVGGAVHAGELSEEAVIREVLEETGVKFEIDRLAVVHENFYNGFYLNTIGKTCHEIAFYYLMKPTFLQDYLTKPHNELVHIVTDNRKFNNGQ